MTADVSPARDRDPRTYVALVVVGAAVLQALWIAVLPPFRGSDEFDHAYRAAAVAGGQWRATEAPADSRGLLVEVPPELVAAAHGQCSALEYTGPENCSPAGDAGDGLVLVASGAANYHPAYYWVVGTVAKPFSGAASLYAMRIAGALLCLAMLGLAAWAATRQRGWWPRAALVLAMPPVLVYSTAVPAPNGLEMAAGIALWSALLALTRGDLGDRDHRRLVALAAVAAVVLASLRLLGPLFVLMIVATCVVWESRATWMAVTRSPRRSVVAAAGVLAATLGALGWIVVTGMVNPPAEPEGSARWPLGSLVFWPLQAIAAFPLRNEPGPIWVYPVVLALVGAFVVVAVRLGRRRDRVAVGLSVLVAFLLPVVVTALTLDGRGVIWQGRYGLPYSVGIVLLAGAVVGRSPSRGAERWVVVGGAAVLAAVTAACLLRVRATELASGVSSGDPSWHAPAAWMVVVGAVVAWAIFARAVVGRRP